MITEFCDVNTGNYFPITLLDDVFDRPKPETFGMVRYHSWGPLPKKEKENVVKRNALQGIGKDEILGKYAKKNGVISDALYKIRERLKRLQYPKGFNKNDGFSVEEALEKRFRQIYGNDDDYEEDPYMWQVYTWTLGEILERLVFMKLQVKDLFETPPVGVSNNDDINSVGDPYYYSGVDRTTPNLIRPINTRDTWTQATESEYDPLHNYGIRRLIAEGKGCVGYRYSCCYQSIGSEGCILGYPEKTRGSVPQLYTWFGGLPPSETTKLYQGLVFMGNEMKCKYIHGKIKARLNSELVTKLANGKFESLTEPDRKTIYRVAELMHKYNTQIQPGHIPDLPVSKSLKDIETYLRRVIRLEKTTEEKTKTQEREDKIAKATTYLKKTKIYEIFNKGPDTWTTQFPFNEPELKDSSGIRMKLYVDWLKLIFEAQKTFDDVANRTFYPLLNVTLFNITADKTFKNIWNSIVQGNIQRKEEFIRELQNESFDYKEYTKFVINRVPDNTQREYLLELGRLRAEKVLDQFAVDVNRTKELSKITPVVLEDLKKRRKDIEFRELESISNKLLLAITDWQEANDSNQRKLVEETFDKLVSNIKWANDNDWINFINDNFGDIKYVWLQSVGASASLMKAKTFFNDIVTDTLAFINKTYNMMNKENRLNDFKKRIDKRKEQLVNSIEIAKKITSLKDKLDIRKDPKGTDFYIALKALRETVSDTNVKKESLEKIAKYILYKRPGDVKLASEFNVDSVYTTRYLFETEEFMKGTKIKTMDALKEFNKTKILEFRTGSEAIPEYESNENAAVYYPDTEIWKGVYEYHMKEYIDALGDVLDSEKTATDIRNRLQEMEKITVTKLDLIK
jgi:recombinational DNA repair protein RecR